MMRIHERFLGVWLCSGTSTRDTVDYEEGKASEVGHVINHSQWIAVPQCGSKYGFHLFLGIVFLLLKFFPTRHIAKDSHNSDVPECLETDLSAQKRLAVYL